MYHGGSNPKGKLSTLQESKASGGANDLPVINYDFRAPIRQYGQISDNYKEIKLFSLFLKEFGGDMAVLKEDIETWNVNPEDMETLRVSWRHDHDHGYVFFNNYQRRRTMKDHKDVSLLGKCEKEVNFPSISIRSGEYGFFPYHMSLDNKTLITATATPLCKLSTKQGNTFVFYGDWNPNYIWKDGLPASVLHLTREEALNAWKVTLDQEYLVLSDNYVWEEDGNLIIVGNRNTMVKTYPPIKEGIPGFTEGGKEGIYTLYERSKEGKESKVTMLPLEEKEEYKTYQIQLEYGSNIKDCFLGITYVGDSLELYSDGEMINDHFYTGERLEISMRYFNFPNIIEVKIYPLAENAPYYLETWPKMTDGKACDLMVVVLEEQVW